MPEITVNYWAILVSAIASMIMGSLWYGPLFGNAWKKSLGIANMSEEQIQCLKKTATPGYFAMFSAALVMAYVLNHVLVAREATTFFDAIHIGSAMWIGFVGLMGLSVKFFENKPWSYYFINRGYDLVNILVAATVITLWK